MTTTTITTWAATSRSTICPRDTVADFVGDQVTDEVVDLVTAAYRAAINDALPDVVALVGDDFVGEITDLSEKVDLRDEVVAAVAEVDLAAIVELYC